MMARTLDRVLVEDFSAEARARIEARAGELIAEIDGLKAVRKLAGMSQAQIAEALGKRQPSVQKMERQADYYVSTLRRFVEAAGGTVEIRVTLPGHDPVRLREFGDLNA
jgi:predicted XRE-type DNA-binding protein